MAPIRNYTRSENMLEAVASRNYIFSGVSISTNGFNTPETEETKLHAQEIMQKNGFKVIWLNSSQSSEAYARRVMI